MISHCYHLCSVWSWKSVSPVAFWVCYSTNGGEWIGTVTPRLVSPHRRNGSHLPCSPWAAGQQMRAPGVLHWSTRNSVTERFFEARHKNIAEGVCFIWVSVCSTWDNHRNFEGNVNDWAKESLYPIAFAILVWTWLIVNQIKRVSGVSVFWTNKWFRDWNGPCGCLLSRGCTPKWVDFTSLASFGDKLRDWKPSFAIRSQMNFNGQAYNKNGKNNITQHEKLKNDLVFGLLRISIGPQAIAWCRAMSPTHFSARLTFWSSTIATIQSYSLGKCSNRPWLNPVRKNEPIQSWNRMNFKANLGG